MKGPAVCHVVDMLPGEGSGTPLQSSCLENPVDGGACWAAVHGILQAKILEWVAKHEPPSHLPPHNVSLGHPHAPAPGMLYPASDIDWRFISYMIVYMFQCHSPKSSHPLPLPQSPKVHSIHLCLFCCLAYRVIVTFFLNSIYMC